MDKKNIKAVSSDLVFLNYTINKIVFENNITADGSVSISPKFSTMFKTDEEKKHHVVFLKVEIGDEGNLPFKIEVEISGDFEIDKYDEMMIKKNTISILFPYLRNIVSNLTTMANLPALILPVVNINKMLEEKKGQKK